MIGEVFADTSALFAYQVPRDERHEEALRVVQELRAARRTLLTSTDVFDELVSLLRRRVGSEAAVRSGNELRGGTVARLVPVDDATRDRAWAIFRAARWPDLSFTDCTSSAIMLNRRIREVFTFDADFRRLGHATLPTARPLLKPRPSRGRSR